MNFRPSRLVLAALAAGVLGAAAAAQTTDHSSHGQQAEGRGKMGRGGMMMGRGHDPATAEQMGVIHQLFADHRAIKRTVVNLPNGIRTITESDDPRVAQLIKDHVTAMDARMRAGDDPGLPMESEALRALFRDHDKINTRLELTPKGAAIVQTSSDRTTVAALQKHASEVSAFAEEGMAAMHAAMMKGRGRIGAH
jgi:hypothetical protein